MTEPSPCPFCGQMPKVTKYPMEGAHPDHDLMKCQTLGCAIHGMAITRDKWEKRLTPECDS